MFVNPPEQAPAGQPQPNPLSTPTASPFSVAGQTLQQGSTFDPGEVNFDSNISSVSQDIDEVLDEEDEKKTGPSKGMLIAIGACIFVVVLIIVIVIAASSGNTDGSDEPSPYEIDTDELYDPADDPANLWVTEPTVAAATEPPTLPTLPAEDMDALRAAGYTAAEIEDIVNQGITDIKPYVDKAAEDKQRFLLEQYHFLQERMAAGIDEETSYVFNNSIFSLPAQELGEPELDTWDQEVPAIRETKRENVNYTKLPMLGNQCLLKITLADDTIVYFYVQPERYQQLEKQEGNIVIKYTEVLWRGCRFIVNIEELPI